MDSNFETCYKSFVSLLSIMFLYITIFFIFGTFLGFFDIFMEKINDIIIATVD